MANLSMLLAGASLCLAWLLPNHYAPWTSYYTESGVALALGFLVIGAACKRQAPRLPNASWVLAAVALIPWVQFAVGQIAFSGDAYIASLYLLGFSLAVAIGYTLADQDARSIAALLATATVAASLVSSVLGLVQVFQFNTMGIWSIDGIQGMRADANLGQPNNLATLIGFGAVGLLLLYEQGRINGRLATLMFLILAVGVSITQSRTALFYGLIVLVGVWWARRRGVSLRTPTWAIGVGAACHWALAWNWPSVMSALLLTGAQGPGERGVGTFRVQIWPVLIDAANDAPLAGFGWLQVGAAQLSAVLRHPPHTELWLSGHNLFLELVLWCGYPLGLLLSGAIVYWFVSRALRLAKVESLVGLLMVAILGWHSMLELPHQYAYLLLPVGLWIGIVDAQRGMREWLPGRVAGATLAMLTAAMTCAIWIEYPAIEEDFRRVRFENMNIGPLRAEDAAPAAPVLSSLTGFLRFARMQPRPGMSAAELDFMQLAVRRYPYAPSMSRYADALAINGRVDDAKQVYEQIRHLHGERRYRSLVNELRVRVVDGHPGLAALDRTLMP